MTKLKFKKDQKFSNNGLIVIEAKKGDILEVNAYCATAFIKKGICEVVGKKDKIEVEVINPVAEVIEELQEMNEDQDEPDLMAIFAEDPERLTVPELQGICKEREIKFHHANKEAKLIELIQEDLKGGE